MFVSSTPAVIASSDSDDDIVVIAHTSGRKKCQPRTASPSNAKAASNVQTQQAVQTLRIDCHSNNDKSDTCTVHVNPLIEATDKGKGLSQAEPEDEILKAIRSIATDLEHSDVTSASVATSSSDLASSQYLFNDDLFCSSEYTSDQLGSFSEKHPWSDLAQSVPDNKCSAAPDSILVCSDDSKSGGRGVKSSFKRSVSSGYTSSSSVPLKKRLLYAAASTSDLDSMEVAVGASHDRECLSCLVNFNNEKLSKCIQGHPCCSDCLQKRAKRILAQERKVCINILVFPYSQISPVYKSIHNISQNVTKV